MSRRAIVLSCLLAPAAARADGVALVDLLSPEIVGELGRPAWDLHAKLGRDEDRFVGEQAVGGGLFVGGGLGARVVGRFAHGVRVGGEASFAGGRLSGAALPFGAAGTAWRVEALGSLGWERALGRRLIVHAATVIGCDFATIDVAPPAGAAALLAPGGAVAASGATWQLERFAMRLGQQVGAHLAVADGLALYADATLDWDGQWRARFGIAILAPDGARPASSVIAPR